MTKKFLLLLLLSLILVSCSSNPGDPAEVVGSYLEAKVAGDGDVLRRSLCAEMEAVLEREMHTFEGVSDVHTEGMSCKRVGDSTTVSCEGKIVALYGTEETEFPLVSYRVVAEDGQWKWCGEAP